MTFYELFDFIICEFVKNKYHTSIDKLNYYNKYLKRFSIELDLNDTNFIVKDLEMSEENRKIMNDIFDKRISVVNFWNNMYRYYDENNIPEFRKLLKENENNINFRTEVLYFEALLKYSEEDFIKAYELIEECRKVSPYNKFADLLRIKIVSKISTLKDVLYLCNKYINLFGKDDDIQLLINSLNIK